MKTKELVAYQNLIEIDPKNTPNDIHGEHDEFFRDEYEVELELKNTLLTYWEWVVEKVEERNELEERDTIVYGKDCKNGVYPSEIDVAN